MVKCCPTMDCHWVCRSDHHAVRRSRRPNSAERHPPRWSMITRRAGKATHQPMQLGVHCWWWSIMNCSNRNLPCYSAFVSTNVVVDRRRQSHHHHHNDNRFICGKLSRYLVVVGGGGKKHEDSSLDSAGEARPVSYLRKSSAAGPSRRWLAACCSVSSIAVVFVRSNVLHCWRSIRK
jgi:hypothetical protein